MPYIAQTRDLTGQYLTYDRDIDTFRPALNQTFTPGLAVQLAPRNTGITVNNVQVYPDYSTVQLPGTGAGNAFAIMGIVSDSWVGFGGSVTPGNYTSGTSGVLQRGTTGVDIVLRGYHPTILVDQSGTGAVTLTNGATLVPSRATSGYSQGVAVGTAVAPLAATAIVALPATGFASSLTAAALAQAAAPSTITGTPAAGDTYTFTVNAPYTTAAPGVAQVYTYTTPGLTSAQATSVTTAAAAVAAYLNAQPSFSQYYIASNAAGVLSWTVNALANPFLVTAGTGTTVTDQFYVSISGMIVNNATNGFTVTAAATGASAIAVTTQFAGGTGYRGTVPGYVPPS